MKKKKFQLPIFDQNYLKEDNIVVGKSDYGQSQLVSGPFAMNNKLEQNE